MSACAIETTNIIIQDFGDILFFILVYKAIDVSTKKQMTVFVCYVNKQDQVIEPFLGIVHVTDTAALSLKVAIEALFARYKLSILRLCG